MSEHRDRPERPLVKDPIFAQQRVERLLHERLPLPSSDLSHIAHAILARRSELLARLQPLPTPCYVFDGAGLAQALQDFRQTFSAQLPRHHSFFAVKSNPHPWVLAAAVQQGFGLDVSSGRELTQALALPDCPIVFSGPAKSQEDHERAVAYSDRIIVHLDSFSELLRLSQTAQQRGRTVRAGVRVNLSGHGAWSKFGIPLADLPRFLRLAWESPGIDLQGVQFHLSWNRSPAPYVQSLSAIAEILASLSPVERRRLRLLDIGGGFRPHRSEGYFPTDHPLGSLLATAADHYDEPCEFTVPYFVKDSVPLADYAAAIGQTLRDRVAPILDCEVYSEPGRIVSTFAMHIALRVVDRKSDDLVIVDGGIHMVGWERYLAIYHPVVNLTHPASAELAVRIGGSLCDCEDIFGRYCYAERMEEGDILLIPYQGAYSYTTAQNFIRDIPKVVSLGPAPTA
jgi:diaminopimelate decarboxylase